MLRRNFHLTLASDFLGDPFKISLFCYFIQGKCINPFIDLIAFWNRDFLRKILSISFLAFLFFFFMGRTPHLVPFYYYSFLITFGLRCHFIKIIFYCQGVRRHLFYTLSKRSCLRPVNLFWVLSV